MLLRVLLPLAACLAVQAACVPGQCETADNVSAPSMLQMVALQRSVGSADGAELRSRVAEDARFLMQASFGPTRGSLAELSKTSYHDWIASQMKLPVESHREYYRQRVNPAPAAQSQRAAAVDTPCAKGSRWHSYAFSVGDVGSTVEVKGTDSIFVGGVLRTSIKAHPLASSWVHLVNFSGYICYVREGLGEDVHVSTAANCKVKKYDHNPPVWRPSGVPEITANLLKVKPGVVVLGENDPACTLDQQLSGGGSVFAQAGGTHYVYNPRLRLADNLPARPAGILSSCVQPNALNEETCKVPLVRDDSASIPGLTVEVAVLTTRRRRRGPAFLSEGGLETSTRLLSEQVDFQHSNMWAGFPPFVYVAARWSGGLTVKTGGSYDLSLDAASGDARLYIDSQLVITNNHPTSSRRRRWGTMTRRSGSKHLSAGSHNITIEFSQVSSYKRLALFWAGPDSGGREELVPASALSTTGEGQLRSGCPVTCGSLGEVASDPAAGHQYSLYVREGSGGPFDNDYDNRYANRMSPRLSKSTVWTMKALEAKDQLRQRVAWALSQIFVVSTQGIGLDSRSEMWLNYYDIFVRHAFGNLRDILREVTFSPVMGVYLTHSYSSSVDYNTRMPNENYAREIMQLFTIGLDLLNKDGTLVIDASGEEIPTYTNDNIMNFARVFTGFINRPNRGNIEHPEQIGGNFIDPMDLQAIRHDIYPKPDLYGNFIGDGHPLCSDPPPSGAFLAKGAKYTRSTSFNPSGALVLGAESALRAALCGPDGACGSAYSVTLSSTLACTSADECSAGQVTLVKAGSAYYEYHPPACVHMFFAEATPNRTALEAQAPTAQPGACQVEGGGKPKFFTLERLRIRDAGTPERQAACLAKCRQAGLNGCEYIYWSRGSVCKGEYGSGAPLSGDGASGHVCWDFKLSGQTGHSYSLQTEGAQACPAGTQIETMAECRAALRVLDLSFDASAWPLIYRSKHRYPMGCSYRRGRMFWSMKSVGHAARGVTPVCRGFVTVDASGAYVPQKAQNKFAMPWPGPAPAAGTYQATAQTMPVFSTAPSDKAAAKARLSVGAYPPPAGTCDVCDGEVKAYFGADGAASTETVFEIDGAYYKNSESVVVLSNGQRFRNPPVFLKSQYAPGAARAAVAEVEATLDHLFHHNNTAIFISKRLIQRFVTSNPSGAYVEAVVDAFRTGTYAGVTYSGRYGDLGATVAAILLHPDARTEKSGVATTTDGALREPMLKIMHLMRSMEYQDADRSQVVFQHLHEVIGQFPYNSPSVFNYYLADYELPMPKTRPEPEPEPMPDMKPEPEPETPTSVVGPEFQIFTPPYFVGYLNGMSSLIQSGVSHRCDDGKSLGVYVSLPDDGTFRMVCPQGRLTWPGAGTPNATLEELNVLLTGGRMTPVAKDVVRRAYEEAPKGQELQRAQQAAVMTAEFNTLGAPLPHPGARPPPPDDAASSKKPYKAFIVLFLAGGADTWNLLVPQECDLYKEYRDIRTDLALNTNELLKISTSGQACSKFGIHASLPFLKRLYEKGEAAFVSNVGNLVEPTTKTTFKSGARRCFNLFSHSDQQNGAQTLYCQEGGTTARGTGGRVADALAADGLLTTSFSLSGSAIWPKGFQTRREIVDEHGSRTFHDYMQWMETIGNITAQRHGNVYSEAYADAFLNNVALSEKLGSVLESAKLKTNLPQSGNLGRQFYQVAKLIASREGRMAERDFFFVQVGGWDMHSSMKTNLAVKFGNINSVLEGFVAEMKAQKVWESVVLATESEFARTLDSNGGGSDHAWAGQQFVISGALKGKQVFNKFPASMKAQNARDLGRGRLIPEYPWESMLVPIGEWLGLKAVDLDKAFPNLKNFNRSQHIIPRSTLFKP